MLLVGHRPSGSARSSRLAIGPFLPQRHAKELAVSTLGGGPGGAQGGGDAGEADPRDDPGDDGEDPAEDEGPCDVPVEQVQQKLVAALAD